jgi:Holliday junction resolvase-like predicted endonuclease
LDRRAALPEKLGEIDLIARRGDLVLIVEVKARPTLMAAMEALARESERRIEGCADLWLSRQPDFAKLSVRFDMVAVLPWRWPCTFRTHSTGGIKAQIGLALTLSRQHSLFRSDARRREHHVPSLRHRIREGGHAQPPQFLQGKHRRRWSCGAGGVGAAVAAFRAGSGEGRRPHSRTLG